MGRIHRKWGRIAPRLCARTYSYSADSCRGPSLLAWCARTYGRVTSLAMARGTRVARVAHVERKEMSHPNYPRITYLMRQDNFVM
jgi:hypothetical protein